MPNQRAPGQKLLVFPASREFIEALDAALARIGYPNRSDFIRQAIKEKLQLARVPLPKSLSGTSVRFGKKPALRYPAHQSDHYALNEAAIPGVVQSGAKVAMNKSNKSRSSL